MASQERGAIALGQAVQGLGVNTRVLMIGAHPDDEDTNLIAWLSRGRHVATAYLSLTRGDGGQNIIGNELGEALGVIRTEELLAARRIDGALQYFTRAYDFGYSKDTADTFAHWQRDSILRDVVRVVRAFRPHVIVAVFSGTTRDGHGQHQVSGMLAREAYDVAGDTLRFPTQVFGGPWTPLKFYRAARGNAQAGTLGMNVGEYSPLLGESFGEIAGRSRSQHKSQGFGALEWKGPIMNYVRREATRVNDATAATSERSLFDGIDTTWARFREDMKTAVARQALDALPDAFAAARRQWDPFAPRRLVAALARIDSLLDVVAHSIPIGGVDAWSSSTRARERVDSALKLASQVTLETNAAEVVPVGREVGLLTTVFNRGPDTVAVSGGRARGVRSPPISITRLLPPGGLLRDTLSMLIEEPSQPWWLVAGRDRGMFRVPGSSTPEASRGANPTVWYTVDLGGSAMGRTVNLVEPASNLALDQVKGELWYPTVGAPAITLRLDQEIQFAPAGRDIDRQITLTIRSADAVPRDVRVSLELPPGLRADSVTRSLQLPRFGETAVTFDVRGRLPVGHHRVAAVAESDGERFHSGYRLIDYDHIRRQRIYRPATTTITAVDVRVPAALRVAYVPGVSDNVAPMLAQLGVSVTVIPAAGIARADLSGFTTVVIGPRAYDANPELVNANPRLFDFARAGGTLVVQYGQYEMTRPGYTPYPITMARPHNRVTHEDAPVTLLDGDDAVLRAPNRITSADFAGWVQERSLYMPRTFDERYRPVLEMSDPGEQPHQGAVLVAPLGRGTYVYTSLAFFRQLPAGVPGAARLVVNLLGAGQPVGGNAP